METTRDFVFAFWWTRSQRIRTVGRIPLEVAVVEASAAPLYQRIATKAARLRRLRLSKLEIARRLGVNDKTVAKALTWQRTTRTEKRS